MQYRRTGSMRTEAMASCGCCWLRSADSSPQINESEICMGKGKRKKPRPKKEKCPVNGTHEWYKEHTTVEYNWSFGPRRRLYKWSEDAVEWTCIHCWKQSACWA